MKGATGVLINITGGLDMTLYEVDEAANEIRAEVDPDANIIVGSTFDESMEGSMRVSVVATGIDAEAVTAPDPRSRVRQQPTQTAAASAPTGPNDAILPWKRTNSERPGRVAQESRAETRSDPLVRRTSDTAEFTTTAPEPEQQHVPLQRAVGAEDMADAVADPYVATEETPITEVPETHNVTAEAPQVVVDQARLAEEAATLNARYEARRATETPAQRVVQDTPAEEPKRGFSLFGRRRKPVEPAPKAAPVAATPNVQQSAPQQAQPSQAPRAASGDLFGDSLDEGDLEIPAFLRPPGQLI